jgi:hypothetical protein
VPIIGGAQRSQFDAQSVASPPQSPGVGQPSTTPAGAPPLSRSQSNSSSSPAGVAATGASASDTQLRAMRALIRQHMERSQLEIIVIVEAIDPHSSNTFQARHSYTSRDIEFDKSFCGCMTVAPDGLACLDWELFHTLKDVPFNASHIIGSSHS